MITNTTQKVIFSILILLSALLLSFPIIYAFLMAFMNPEDISLRKLWPSEFTFENFIYIFDAFPLLHYLKNSLIVTIIITVGQLVTSCLAAYAFVFLKFKGRNVLFYLFISTMLIPNESIVVQNFLTTQNLGLLNSYGGLTLPFFATAFGTFLLRQHFLTVPSELREASMIEGVGHIKYLLKVVIPYCRSSIVTFSVYTFITSWNMYLWPLLVTNNEEYRTVQIGVKQLITEETATQWGGVMAGVIIVMLPTLLLLFISQRFLQKGLTEGAIK
ncbi:glycerol-3-phosphate ABC transporter permease [Bacillaceae bacterium SAOS 7]|nr:glycerol-3-phosphate ABC transporter permease [Bacillaceae bacterium SAOS 7]